MPARHVTLLPVHVTLSVAEPLVPRVRHLAHLVVLPILVGYCPVQVLFAVLVHIAASVVRRGAHELKKFEVSSCHAVREYATDPFSGCCAYSIY